MSEQPQRKTTTDDNCTGWCSCPVCGGPAHWSFAFKIHACSDPECATQFREHEEAECDRWEQPHAD